MIEAISARAKVLAIVMFQRVGASQIRHFQRVFGVAMIASGLYMAFYGSGPFPIEQELSVVGQDVWVGAVILGPIVVGIGDRLAHTKSGRAIYWGWYLQAGGDTVILMVYLTYVIAAFQSSWLERGIFSAFIFIALSISASGMIIRDIWAIRSIEHVRREPKWQS